MSSSRMTSSSTSRPLTPSEATRLMLEKWDRMEALQDAAPTRGRRQRASSVPNREHTKSRVREWERFDKERERLRLIQVETERLADEEAARKVWEGQQESRDRRRRRKKSPTRSETPELLRQLESGSFEWMPSRAVSVGPSVASTGSATAASRYSEDSERPFPFESASEGEPEVESLARSRVWRRKDELSGKETGAESSRGSRRGRRPPASHPRPSPPPPPPTRAISPSSTTAKPSSRRPHPRHRSHSLPARSRRSPSLRPSPSPSPAHTPRSPKDSSPLICSASFSDDDNEPPKTAVEAGLQALEQLPGAIGAGLSKLLPGLFSRTSTDVRGSVTGVVRAEVGRVEEIEDGEMKEVSFLGARSKLLLCKLDGKIYAISSRSTYGATRLVNGVLTADGVVRCRHHDAAFDIRTGAIVDGPPLAPLHTFPTEVDASGAIFISTIISKVDSLEGAAPTRVRRSKEEGGVVIVGGGAAAFYLVDGLRTGGYKGGITLIERGKNLPYDRSKLSKRWMEEEEELLLRQSTYYEKLGVEVRLSTEVVSADFEERFVALGEGSVLNFDKLVIATGATPQKLQLPGSRLDGIFTLRSMEDAIELRRAVNPSKVTRRPLRVIIIGSSFLGTELATLLASNKLTKSRPKVTIISCDRYPLEELLGNRLATSLLTSFTDLGVQFVHSSPVTAFVPSSSSSSHVGAVQLASGERVSADLVLLAIGVKGAAPSWLRQMKGVKSEDGRVEADEKSRIRGLGKKSGVFAIGDVTYRRDKTTGQIVKSEHWNQAANQARALAHYIITSAILPPQPATIIYSSQPHPLHLLLTPSAPAWETTIILGSLDKLSCVAYYAQSNTIVSIAQFEDPKDDDGNPLLVHCKELMRRGKMLTLEDVRARKNPMKRLL